MIHYIGVILSIDVIYSILKKTKKFLKKLEFFA